MSIQCPKCTMLSSDGAAFCYSCGFEFNIYGQQQFSSLPNTTIPYNNPFYQQGYNYPYGITQSQKNYADPSKRLLANIIDGLAIFLACIPGLIVLFIGMGLEAVGITVLGAFLCFVASVSIGFYNIYLLGKEGTSIGKKWAKIRCLGTNGLPIGFGKAFLRELLKNIIGSVLFGLLNAWLLFDQEKQQLYDKAMGTHVYQD